MSAFDWGVLLSLWFLWLGGIIADRRIKRLRRQVRQLQDVINGRPWGQRDPQGGDR